MVGMLCKRGRHPLKQGLLHLQWVAARSQAGAIAYPKDMGVHRHRGFAKGDIEHHVGGLAPHAGQGLQLLAGAGHLAFVPIDQQLAHGDHVCGFGTKQPDCANV